MTVARNSQTVAEVLRTNNASKAQASQIVVEVLRPNAAEVPPPDPSTRRPIVIVFGAL